MAKLPQVQWAQRSDKVYLTIDLQEAKDPQISIENDDAGGKVSFRGAARSHAVGPEDHDYSLDLYSNVNEEDSNATLELYGKVSKEDSKVAVNPRNIVLVLAKEDFGFWPRLLRTAGKAPNNIKVDWNKWVDEDEEEGAEDLDFANLQDSSKFDLGSMGGGGGGGPGGPGGMGGMDMEQMLKMGGAGGMGGMPGMGGGAGGGAPDMAQMQEMIAKMKASTAKGVSDAGGLPDDDSDDDDVPPLDAA